MFCVVKIILFQTHFDKILTKSLNQVRTVLLHWLPWALRMQRPRKKITRKTIANFNKMKEINLNERYSKSLIANVLDIDDDLRQVRRQSATPSTSISRLLGKSLDETGFPCQQQQQQQHSQPSTSYCYNSSRELHNIVQELR